MDASCNDPNKQKVNLFGDRDDLYLSYEVCGELPYARTEFRDYVSGDYDTCIA